MPREFNFIYKKLVEDRNDIIGHIAYSIYKQDKVDFITDQKEKLQREITKDDLRAFHEISSKESSVESYKIKAELIMQAFFENTFEEITKDIERQTKENQLKAIKEVVEPLKPKFWNRVLSGIVSAFIFALILAAIAFILQYRNSTINISIDQKNQETEQSK